MEDRIEKYLLTWLDSNCNPYSKWFEKDDDIAGFFLRVRERDFDAMVIHLSEFAYFSESGDEERLGKFWYRCDKTEELLNELDDRRMGWLMSIGMPTEEQIRSRRLKGRSGGRNDQMA